MEDQKVTRSRSAENRRQLSNAGTAQDPDTLFKLRFEEALGDTQVAGKLAKIIRSTNQDMLDGIDALRAEVRSLRKELGERDAIIEDLQAEVKGLRLVNDALEQYGRRNNLRISGIPESALDEGENEDTTAAVVDLANTVLQLDPPLQPSDIEVSLRLKKPRKAKPTEPRPIIVRFRSKAERYRVISNRKNLRPSNDTKDIKVYINEDLTTARAKLFSTVRLLFRQKHFTQVWTYNGCIKVKDLRGTLKSINSIDDVKNCLPDINIP